MTGQGLDRDRWVVTNPIPGIVSRVRYIRAGDPPNPAEAVRVLQVFALRREIDDLLELEPDRVGAGTFDRLDALAVLAFAALTRPVDQAARLAIGRWEKERPGTSAASGAQPARLTDGIVHDVTAQRTVPEVAVFIKVCREAELARAGEMDTADSLVHKALTSFAGPSSGRTNLDKAFLYIALNHEGCQDTAALLLEMALGEAAASAPARDDPRAVERDGIVRTLSHVSPSDHIVESWVDRRVRVRSQESAVLGLVAGLLVGEPTGAESLAKHVGRTWHVRLLKDLCELLVKRSERCLAMVRRYAASRIDDEDLYAIILAWQASDLLSPSLRYLLADIVADGGEGAPGPRTIAFLDNLDTILRNAGAPRECRTRLRIAMAEHVEGRTGKQVAQLLGEVAGRDQRRTAQVVNERLSALLQAGEIGGEVFAEYIKNLQDLGRPAGNLTFWAVRERADPKAADRAPEPEAASALGDIAARLYTAAYPRIGFDLLERSLENEQAVTPENAAAIVRRVRQEAEMPGDEHWQGLFGATVGRWADERRRDAVVAELRGQGFHEEADAVVNSVQ